MPYKGARRPPTQAIGVKTIVTSALRATIFGTRLTWRLASPRILAWIHSTPVTTVMSSPGAG